MGIECRFIDPADPGEFPPRHRRQDALLLRRDAAQSEARGVPDRRGRQDRPRTRRAADHGQHRLPGAVPADQAWRRHHHALDHEIHRRPRHLDRRRHRRRRQFRLGEARRPLPDAEYAGPELPRRGLDAGGQAARPDRLHHQGAGHAAARHRRGDVAVQRLHVHPGPGDARAAHARALRNAQRGGAISRQASEGHQGDLSRPDDAANRSGAPTPI